MSWRPEQMFKKKSPQEMTEALLSQESMRHEIETLTQLGKNILADGRYKKYKEAFEDLLGKSIKMLLEYDHPDNNIYSTQIKVLRQKIKDLLAFIDTPVNFLNLIAAKPLPQREK